MSGAESSIPSSVIEITHTCPHCGVNIPSILKAQALILACSSCHYSIQRLADGKLVKLNEFKVNVEPDIPLYSTGILHGVTYQVVGFLQKRQIGTTYDWREYLLFNPYHGYAILSEYNGHWNYIISVKDYSRQYLRTAAGSIVYKANIYKLYNRYKGTVKYAIGEFNSDILAERDTQVEEYICPPFMMVKESNGDELRWYLGEYVSSSEIKKIFNLNSVPARTGVGATQLFWFGTQMGTMYMITLVYALLLLVIQLFYDGTAKNEKVFARNYGVADTNAQQAIVTPSFELTGGKSAVQFDVAAPINNDWFDLDIELINHQTGERFEVAKSIEFYSGVDGGEYWSEGKREDYIIVSEVPDGTYHLNLYPHWNSLSSNPVTFDIRVFRDVALWANFVLLLLLGCLPVVLHFFMYKTFEARRWMESDYSPYSSYES